MRVAIIEDDDSIAERTEELTEDFFHQAETEEFFIRRYPGGNELLRDLKENAEYDLYLMDLQLPDMDGIKLLEKVRRRGDNAQVIIVSSHSEYAVACIHGGILDFVRKEELEKELNDALKKAWKKHEGNGNRCYYIRKDNTVKKILFYRILYVETDKKYTVFHCWDGVYSERRPLKDVYRELPEEDFVYINNGQIVNLWRVDETDNDTVLLDNGKSLPVSRRRKKEFIDKMLRYIGRKN